MSLVFVYKALPPHTWFALRRSQSSSGFCGCSRGKSFHFKSHTRPRRLTQKCALSSVNFRANRIEAKLLAAHFTTPVNVCVCSPDLGVVTLEELSEIYKNKTGVWMKRLGVEWSLGYRSFELQLTIITNCWWQRRLEISEVESEMSDTIYKASRSSSLSTTF